MWKTNQKKKEKMNNYIKKNVIIDKKRTECGKLQEKQNKK